MSKYIDLSHEIIDNMPVHPYDDEVKLYQDKFLDKDKYNNHKLEIGMHAGTHIDAPMHLIESNIFIDEIKIDKFIGNGCLIDVRAESIIGYKKEYEDIVQSGDIVLLYSGHGSKYGTEEYYDNYPIIDEELANFFIKKNIKMLGIDLPSPDNYPFNIHKMLFNKDILLIENLHNLSELLDIKNFEVMAFPLKIHAEAAPVRVVAKVE